MKINETAELLLVIKIEDTFDFIFPPIIEFSILQRGDQETRSNLPIVLPLTTLHTIDYMSTTIEECKSFINTIGHSGDNLRTIRCRNIRAFEIIGKISK